MGIAQPKRWEGRPYRWEHQCAICGSSIKVRLVGTREALDKLIDLWHQVHNHNGKGAK